MGSDVSWEQFDGHSLGQVPCRSQTLSSVVENHPLISWVQIRARPWGRGAWEPPAPKKEQDDSGVGVGCWADQHNSSATTDDYCSLLLLLLFLLCLQQQ